MNNEREGMPEDGAEGGVGANGVDYELGVTNELKEIDEHVDATAVARGKTAALKEEMHFELEGKKWQLKLAAEKVRAQEAKNRDREKTTELRGEYAEKAYKLASGSISFWVVIIGFEAVVRLVVPGKVILSDSVLIAITTGCTVNVLAAFLGVIRGLFPSFVKSKKRKKEAE